MTFAGCWFYRRHDVFMHHLHLKLKQKRWFSRRNVLQRVLVHRHFGPPYLSCIFIFFLPSVLAYAPKEDLPLLTYLVRVPPIYFLVDTALSCSIPDTLICFMSILPKVKSNALVELSWYRALAFSPSVLAALYFYAYSLSRTQTVCALDLAKNTSYRIQIKIEQPAQSQASFVTHTSFIQIAALVTQKNHIIMLDTIIVGLIQYDRPYFLKFIEVLLNLSDFLQIL